MKNRYRTGRRNKKNDGSKLRREATGRLRAEQALRESEEKFRSLVETTGDWIWEMDVGMTFTYSSPQVQNLIGYDWEQTIGKTPFDFMREDEAREIRELLSEIYKKREPFSLKQCIARHKHGGEVIFETTGVPIFGSSGVFQGYRGISRDITQREKAAEEQRLWEARVRQSQKMESLGVLAGGIAHDFNNLLTSIMGNAELALSEVPADHPVCELLEEIEVASKRAAELSGHMLAYSGHGKFVVEDINLNTIISDLSSFMDSSVTQRAKIICDLKNDLPPLRGDTTEIRQLALNLVANASDAIGESGGEIVVRTGVRYCDGDYLSETLLDDPLEEGCYVFLEVSDSGIGMDIDTQLRIFDPFFTTKFMGRGLGLASVLGIVRGHDGGIRLKSAPGEGSTFTVLFPALNRQPAVEIPSDPGDPVADEIGGTILLVDDEELVRKTVRALLQKAGYAVFTAESGAAALEVFRQHGSIIDCVLLDLTMPEMDGAETFRQLRRIRDDVCVILVSGHAEREVKAKYLEEGFAGFLHKPYQSATLVKALTSAYRAIEN